MIYNHVFIETIFGRLCFHMLTHLHKFSMKELLDFQLKFSVTFILKLFQRKS